MQSKLKTDSDHFITMVTKDYPVYYEEKTTNGAINVLYRDQFLENLYKVT